MSFLLIPHVVHYLRVKLDNSLWVSDLEHIIEVKLSLVLPQPLLPPLLHFFNNSLELLLIKTRSDEIPLLRLADQAGRRLDLLDQLVDHHGLILVVLSPDAGWHGPLLPLGLSH